MDTQWSLEGRGCVMDTQGRGGPGDGHILTHSHLAIWSIPYWLSVPYPTGSLVHTLLAL